MRRVAVPAPLPRWPASAGCGCASAGSWGCISRLRPLLRRGRALGGLAVFVPLLLLHSSSSSGGGHLLPSPPDRLRGLRCPGGSGPAARCGWVTEAKAHRRGVRPCTAASSPASLCQRAAGGSRRGQACRTLPPERCTASGPDAAALFCARTLPAAPCWCSRASRWKPGRASLAQPAPSGTAP